MIARNTHTEEMRANPNYDDHYQNFRNPLPCTVRPNIAMKSMRPGRNQAIGNRKHPHPVWTTSLAGRRSLESR